MIAKKPTDEVVRCEECDRILVRTGESGTVSRAIQSRSSSRRTAGPGQPRSRRRSEPLLKDAATGAVLAEVGETIGVATNNVAEYRGLIAGLELAAEHAPGRQVEVRMDSKLVVEQMSGNWKVKHPVDVAAGG